MKKLLIVLFLLLCLSCGNTANVETKPFNKSDSIAILFYEFGGIRIYRFKTDSCSFIIVTNGRGTAITKEK